MVFHKAVSQILHLLVCYTKQSFNIFLLKAEIIDSVQTNDKIMNRSFRHFTEVPVGNRCM